MVISDITHDGVSDIPDYAFTSIYEGTTQQAPLPVGGVVSLPMDPLSSNTTINIPGSIIPGDATTGTATLKLYGYLVADEAVVETPGYTTRERVENYLLITVDETFYDTVEEYIQAVTDYIEGETGRVFIADGDASDRVFDGKGDNTLFIDDAIEVVSVKINDTEVDATNLVSYPANDTPKIKLQLKAGRFPVGKQNITVNAKWGYSATVPSDIRFAATVLVAGIINTSNGGQGDVQSETIGRYSVTYKSTKEMTDFEQATKVLEAYNRIRL